MTKSRPPGPADLPLLGSVFPWLRDQPRFLLETYRHYGEVVRFEFLGFHGALLHGAEANRYILIDAVDNFQVGPVTLRAGALCEARQTAQSQQSADGFPTVPLCEKQVISTDGAYVPLVQGQWAEVRTVAIGEVKEKITRRHQDIETQHLSYFSRMTDAVTFGERADVEMRRRGVSQAKAVCAVTDGADWIQGFVDLHRADALRVLDFPHAAEHINLLIEALQHAGVLLPEDALERSLHVLKHRGPGLLLRWCDRLPAAPTSQETIQKQLTYLRKRASLMQYPAYQRQGWPIGSGMVESANKVVVQARLKGAGMRLRTYPCQSHAHPTDGSM